MNVQVTLEDNKKLRLIDELDLEPIAFKLRLEHEWSIEQINHAVGQYRLWLKMVALHPNESIIPNKEVDEVWHTHILDTRKYAEDCDNIFGRFIHHFPYFGLRDEADRQDLQEAFDQSQAMMLEEFGENLRSFLDDDPQGALCGPEACDPSIYASDRRPNFGLLNPGLVSDLS